MDTCGPLEYFIVFFCKYVGFVTIFTLDYK